MAVDPWVPVDPSTIKAAALGPLPIVPVAVTTPTTIVYSIPTDVVPANATGILVFAYYIFSGQTGTPARWQFSVNAANGKQNWFKMMLGSLTWTDSVAFCNSQSFWLPMPTDGNLTVTLAAGASISMNDISSGVEIHGYSVA